MRSEAGCQRNIKNGVARLIQQGLCMLDSAAKHELMRCRTRCLAEKAAKVRCAQSNILRQFTQRDFFFDVRMNKLRHTLHPVRSQSAFVNLNGAARNAAIPDENCGKRLLDSIHKQAARGISVHPFALKRKKQ